jgi:hypothetical protein
MPMYTFFLCSDDGTAPSFESFELVGDEHAPARALQMLAEHRSCSYVAIWQGERPVAVRARTPDVHVSDGAA